MTTALRYPRSDGHVVVPRGDRRSMWEGLGLYAPSRTPAIAMHTAVSLAVRAGAGPLLCRDDWVPPTDWPWEVWQERIDGADRVLGAYERPQASREGGAVLLGSRGRRRTLIKLRTAPAPELDHEATALRAVAAARPTTFAVPDVIADGTDGGLRWIALGTIPRNHRPIPDLPDAVPDEISRVLDGVVPPSEAGPPSHGDLTPWNVRVADGRTWVVDWEDAGSRPAGADATLHHAWTVLLGLCEPRPCPESAVDHWISVVSTRPEGDADRHANDALLEVLERLRS